MNCVVVGGHLMTSNGWGEMRHLFNSGDIPFRIFAQEDRRFLQWTGEANIRNMLQGRLVKVNLACRVEGESASEIFCCSCRNLNFSTCVPAGPHMRNLNTSPCIAFRVVGTPIKTTSSKLRRFFNPVDVFFSRLLINFPFLSCPIHFRRHRSAICIGEWINERDTVVERIHGDCDNQFLSWPHVHRLGLPLHLSEEEERSAEHGNVTRTE